MADSQFVKRDNSLTPEKFVRGRKGGMSRQPRGATHRQLQAEIGQRLRWARELVEPNRSAFARQMGVDSSTVQKIEDGARPPSIFNVLDFAHALRVTPDYLLIGSMRGIDSELAALLAARHPELVLGSSLPASGLGRPGTATDAGSDRPPTRPTGRRSV